MVDLIVKTAVKARLGEHQVSEDFYEALDQKVAGLVEDAAERAEANNRKTVQPHDVHVERIKPRD